MSDMLPEEAQRRAHQMNFCTCQTVLPEDSLVRLGRAWYCPLCKQRVRIVSPTEAKAAILRELEREAGDGRTH